MPILDHIAPYRCGGPQKTAFLWAPAQQHFTLRRAWRNQTGSSTHRAVPSWLAVRARLPSGRNRTMLTQLVCAAITPMHWPARSTLDYWSESTQVSCGLQQGAQEGSCAGVATTPRHYWPAAVRACEGRSAGMRKATLHVHPERSGPPRLSRHMVLSQAKKSPGGVCTIIHHHHHHHLAACIPEMTSYMRAVLLAQPRMAKRVQGDSATHSTPPAQEQHVGRAWVRNALCSNQGWQSAACWRCAPARRSVAQHRKP